MNLDNFFLHHDMLHYAVETTMNFRSAFYGIIASGISISDFGLPKHQRNIQLSSEAIYAEYIVNLFMAEGRQSKFEDFNTKLNEGLQHGKNLMPPMSLTTDQIKSIYLTYADLSERWDGLTDGESISLQFKE